VYRNTLAALCALADLTLGRLGPEEIRQVAASGDPPLASPAAVRAVAGFLGVELGPEDLPGLPEDPETGRAREALQALVPRRNALTILADLADDSGSETTRSRVSRLLEVVPPDQDLGNDELEALRHYLALKGRQVQPDTLAALCVFTDFEAGLLSVEDIDSLTPRRGFIDISLYGMLAVSAAFDAELRAFLIQEPDPSARLRALKALTELGEGLIARFRQEGTPGYYTLCLADPDLVDNVALRTDLEFTGEVLVRLPMLEHLHERDLELFHATGKPVVACFSSEDRHLQWRLLQALADRPAALDLLGTFSYVEGYSLYRFNGKVLGRLAEAEARQLLGAAQVVPAYIDARGNYHYRRVERVNSPEDLTTPPQHGLEWAGKVVQFPLVEDLPRVLREPTHQYLLGRPEDRPEEERRLDRIYSAVRDYLTESEETLTLFTGSPQYQRLTREVAGRAFAEGASMVETGVRLAFQAALQKGELQITLSVPLMDALEVEETQDLAALLVLHGYAQALGRPQEPLAEVLLERLHRLTDAPARHLRWLACRLLGTDLFADREERRLAVGYILARAMESEGPRLSRAAARSMAALALARGVPAPPLVQVRVAHPPGEAELFRLEADELRVRLAEWAHQSDSRLGQGMRAPRRAEVLAELMAGLNQSFRRDGSLARQRFLVALGSAELARLRQAALATWKTFAGSRGMLVSQLPGSAPAEQIQDDYALFTVERSGSTPLLGSPTRPLTAVVLQPGEQCGPPGPGGESEPLFSLLAESAPGLMDGSLSLCRLLEAGGQTLAVEPERHLVTVARSVDPRDVLMYDPRHHAWTPLLGSPGHRLEDLGLPPGELGEYRAMLELVGAPAAGAGAAPPPSPPGRPRDLLQLADDLAQFFNFSPERHRSALNMLVGLAPVSRLPLPEPPAPQAPSLEAVS
ncbi:MAG TPA: hypothetical protein VNO81_13735, partial [Candidatus Nitrosotenuis sp.]|nr:hypothetical protein [Candidatus Nitrosotenuis sp.]